MQDQSFPVRLLLSFGREAPAVTFKSMSGFMGSLRHDAGRAFARKLASSLGGLAIAEREEATLGELAEEFGLDVAVAPSFIKANCDGIAAKAWVLSGLPEGDVLVVVWDAKLNWGVIEGRSHDAEERKFSRTQVSVLFPKGFDEHFCHRIVEPALLDAHTSIYIPIYRPYAAIARRMFPWGAKAPQPHSTDVYGRTLEKMVTRGAPDAGKFIKAASAMNALCEAIARLTATQFPFDIVLESGEHLACLPIAQADYLNRIPFFPLDVFLPEASGVTVEGLATLATIATMDESAGRFVRQIIDEPALAADKLDEIEELLETLSLAWRIWNAIYEVVAQRWIDEAVRGREALARNEEIPTDLRWGTYEYLSALLEARGDDQCSNLHLATLAVPSKTFDVSRITEYLDHRPVITIENYAEVLEREGFLSHIEAVFAGVPIEDVFA